MSRTASRRAAIGMAAAATFAEPKLRVAVAQEVSESGGLGLMRAEIEARYGAGVAGQSFMIYTDPVSNVDLHIGYEDEVVDYVWLDLGDERAYTGIALDDAWSLAGSLLPEDARLREEYLRQDTPGSIAQVQTARYTSRWLDDMLDGRSSILVTVMSVPGAGGDEAIHGVIQVETR